MFKELISTCKELGTGTNWSPVIDNALGKNYFKKIKRNKGRDQPFMDNFILSKRAPLGCLLVDLAYIFRGVLNTWFDISH